ncbi:hypothetical protein MMC13_007671 [Lambiella insularis]|nr:hypothetical protein [Lambiella insularis]
MPEIGEVARIVSYIRQHLVGRVLATVKAQHDENVFGKVGTSAAEFEKALTGKKVLDAKQQGKYFWLEMSSPPHPLMHFGMTGWFKIKGLETAYYKPTKPASEEWPPKYWKFLFETLTEPDQPSTQAAFVDSRRFARIRLVDCPATEMRSTTPLKENGPDPVIDKDILTEEWLSEMCLKKHIPIKALLLDQANVSGIGNWVGYGSLFNLLWHIDEIMYDAKIHPEQYSNTLSKAQIAQLHKSIHYVCSLAVETKADSSQFPEEWLFKHRWGKGKKDSKNQLPNGAKISFVTVGGRTSAVVPSVQKKTGKVAGDVRPEDKENGDGDEDSAPADDDLEEDQKPVVRGKRQVQKSKNVPVTTDKEPKSNINASKSKSHVAKSEPSDAKPEPKSKRVSAASGTVSKSRKRKSKADEDLEAAAEPDMAEEPEQEEQEQVEPEAPQRKRRKPASKEAVKESKKKTRATPKKGATSARGGNSKVSKTLDETPGRRRSARVSGVRA